MLYLYIIVNCKQMSVLDDNECDTNKIKTSINSLILQTHEDSKIILKARIKEHHIYYFCSSDWVGMCQMAVTQKSLMLSRSGPDSKSKSEVTVTFKY